MIKYIKIYCTSTCLYSTYNKRTSINNRIRKIGFKAVYLELLSPYEQAQIFNNAKIIAGPHGSGFANLIFVDHGCKVVEIDHGTHEPRSFYAQMTKMMSCHYYPFYIDQTTAAHLEDDMEIDIMRFIQFLNQLF